MEPKETIVDGQKNEVLALRIKAIKDIVQNKPFSLSAEEMEKIRERAEKRKEVKMNGELRKRIERKIKKEIKMKKERGKRAIRKAEIAVMYQNREPNEPILENFVVEKNLPENLSNKIEVAIEEEKKLIEAGIKPIPIEELILRKTTRQKVFMRDMYQAIKIIIKEKKINSDNPMVSMFVKGIEKALEGDYDFYRDIMDRYYGKPSTSLEVSGHLDNKIDISDEQYKQLVVLINQRIERDAGNKGSTEQSN